MLEKTNTIVKIAAHLARGLMTRFFSQSIIALPNTGKEVSQECTLGELLEKQKAAKIRNGVVGITGSKAPMIPKITHIQPRMNKLVL